MLKDRSHLLPWSHEINALSWKDQCRKNKMSNETIRQNGKNWKTIQYRYCSKVYAVCYGVRNKCEKDTCKANLYFMSVQELDYSVTLW